MYLLDPVQGLVQQFLFGVQFGLQVRYGPVEFTYLVSATLNIVVAVLQFDHQLLYPALLALGVGQGVIPVLGDVLDCGLEFFD